MSTIVLTSHSAGTEHETLANLLRPNKQAYADARGYELVDMVLPYDRDGYLAHLDRIRQELSKGNTVLAVGADVIFTNFGKGLGSVPHSPVVVAEENLRWWPINNDVIVLRGWCGDKTALRVIDRIIEDREIWCSYPWLWQNHLWNLICTDKVIKSIVSIVPARVMNSTLHPGVSQWQLGDWICHLLDMHISKKIEWAQTILRIAGKCDGTFYP